VKQNQGKAIRNQGRVFWGQKFYEVRPGFMSSGMATDGAFTNAPSHGPGANLSRWAFLADLFSFSLAGGWDAQNVSRAHEAVGLAPAAWSDVFGGVCDCGFSTW